MKNLFLFCMAAALCAPLCAAPVTSSAVNKPATASAVSRPATASSVVRPSTAGGVSRPSTSSGVSRPTTAGAVARPATTVTVQRPGERPMSYGPDVSASSSAGAPAGAASATVSPAAKSTARSEPQPSYEPSYKQAKDLTASSSVPAAAELNSDSEVGLGLAASSANERNAAAAEYNKEGAQRQITAQNIRAQGERMAGIVGKAAEKEVADAAARAARGSR